MSPVETTVHAAIEAIDEPRSARMDQRTKSLLKNPTTPAKMGQPPTL
jgi:hypothetical protein